ncbi:Zn finger protein, partial [Elasticomyces elasticus]
MTTIYPTQTYTMPQPIQQSSWYDNHGQPSPASSTSPRSPRSNDSSGYVQPNPARQLRPLKSPLYVPAVLRPTEHFPTMQSPATPPRSTKGSLDDPQLQEQDQCEQDDKFLEAVKIEKELGE